MLQNINYVSCCLFLTVSLNFLDYLESPLLHIKLVHIVLSCYQDLVLNCINVESSCKKEHVSLLQLAFILLEHLELLARRTRVVLSFQEKGRVQIECVEPSEHYHLLRVYLKCAR